MRRPKPSPYQHMVHQRSSGRWMVAWYEPSLRIWVVPLSWREQKARNCSILTTANLDDLSELTTPTYATAEGAFRRAHKLFDARRGDD